MAAIGAYGMKIHVAGRRPVQSDFDSFLDNSPDPMIVSSFGGRTLRVNRAFESAFGYSIVDLASEAPLAVIHPSDRERVGVVYGELASGLRLAASLDCRAQSADEAVLWVSWNMAAIPEHELIVTVARDETARRIAEDKLRALNDSLEPAVVERTRSAEARARQAERAAREVRRAEEQLRIFVENTPAAVAMFDRDMRYLVASRRWSEDFGLGPESLVGRSHYDVFPDVDARWRNIHQRCLQGATVECDEDRLRRADGTVEWVRWETHPWRTADGDVGGIIILVEMITARRRAAQELHETTDRLTRINSELEAFTYSVSHDLKEPLRTLEAFSQFLLNDYGEKLDAEGKDYLTRLASASARMKLLIDELLTISRVGQPEQLGPVAVDAVIMDILEGIRATVEERNATVVVAPDLPEVLGDHRRVGQIFANLISNGIKFNRSAAPRVEIGAQVDASGATVFFVRDNGIGIEPQYHQKIFGVFQRLHRREEFEGTGAGLAIVRRAVEALGGNIWVESELGVGSTFLFTLPDASARQVATTVIGEAEVPANENAYPGRQREDAAE